MKGLLPVFLLAVSVAGCPRPVRVILVYEVDPVSNRNAAAVDIQTVARAVRARAHPNRVRVLDDGRIEVGLSDDDPAKVERMDRVIQALGTLEFRVLANDRDHPALIERASKTDVSKVYDEQRNLLGWWVPVATGKASTFQAHPKIVLRTTESEERKTAEVLVVNDGWNVNGGYLVRVATDVDQTGRPCLSFELNNRGGQLMRGLTGDNLPDDAANFRRRLGVILNGTLHSAPAIDAVIGERGQITGDFTPEEVEDMVNLLNAGSLPAKIRKVSQRKVDG